MKYNHQKIEKKWQREWEKRGLYHTPNAAKGKENFYALVEFPYPSGNLHTGHWYAFSVPDIFVRAKRMQGFNVMFPIGFDAFGLPAENAAIKRKLNPRQWTYSNIAYMRKQLRLMGASFDWSREVITCDSAYYRWTQWIFLQLFKKGLAYQARTPVNWCPSCKTVLANEQVVAGTCERCGSAIEQRTMKQWMLKITDYAEKLLNGLEKLNWPEGIKEAQRNWIGKSEGAEIEFPISHSKFSINVFTTRPDTLFGATYMVFAPEHPLVQNLKSKIKNQKEVEDYIKKAKSKTELERQQGEKEKTGVELKGVAAINPATKEEVPIFIADYVLAHYGTGAIMAVPAHDERDFEFAKKFGLSIKEVIRPDISDENSRRGRAPSPAGIMNSHQQGEVGIKNFQAKYRGESVYEGEGILTNSGKFDGMQSENAKRAITEFVGGGMTVQYKLRDWVLSRQRYWGTPIPLVYCTQCGDKIKNQKSENKGEEQNPGWFAVPDAELPVKLPELKDYMPTGDGKSPLAKTKKWVKTKCPKCNGNAERETDTMDTFVDSSWYFLRYCDPNNKTKFADSKKMKLWMPVDCYSGGAEHTTMHLLYSRFWMKAMYDCGLVEWSEPYAARMNRGIILGSDWQKMSKSKGNVVDPDEYVQKLGADTVRMYLAFIGPYSEVGSYPWNPQGILGIRRFLDRAWKLAQKFEKTTTKKNYEGNTKLVRRITHKTIQKVSQDINNFHFNTAISSLMVLLNEFESYALSGELFRSEFLMFLKILAPFAPYITEEIWNKLGNKKSIHLAKWPTYDPKLVEDETFELVIQINGKVRDKIVVPAAITQQEAEELTFSREKVKNILRGRQPRKVFFVPKRLLNIVV